MAELPGAVLFCCTMNAIRSAMAEGLMKQGVDESYAPGVRLDEWEDDGTDTFDRLWRQLQRQDWPIWEAA